LRKKVEATIIGKAKNIEYDTYTTVIVNPAEDFNVADITKINNNTYGTIGEINVSIDDKFYPASFESTFSNNSLELIIKVKNYPGHEELLIHFKGNGVFSISSSGWGIL
jgi:hypothetical protein